MLPITHTTWAFRQKICHAAGDHIIFGKKRWCYTQTYAIQVSTQWLIERLYIPATKKRHEWGTVLNGEVNTLTFPFNVGREAINWGDLHCVDVERKGRGFYVLVEEAGPNCYNLQGYITKWLNEWGWKYAHVETEW